MTSEKDVESAVDDIKEVLAAHDIESTEELSDEEIYERIIEGKNSIKESQQKVRKGVLVIILILIGLWAIYIVLLFAKPINPDVSIFLSISSVGLGSASIVFIYHTLLS
ncbi:hypothetical protein ALNOE001_20000 [Candidatus Methanobinarius endosymbioticus]|uniref:Uncharacterized protein n=1 Tax=Candidatus Methanobinarius endosymbioticus TaxID=2006182 RepID=A0A366M9V1_9EURY|nr:hypothetical protein ALNOE001_20000 [Candidatus Methanobinarius endosymbioticus]